MKGNSDQSIRIPNLILIYCPDPDVSFSLINFCVRTSPETLVKIDHHPGRDNIGCHTKKTKKQKNVDNSFEWKLYALFLIYDSL